jgi:lysophospholipase L1-like esterase
MPARPGRRRILVVAALLTSTTVALSVSAGIYMLLERPRYRLLGSLRQAGLVCAYLMSPPLRRFARTLGAQDPKTDLFATLWDTNTGVLLSRRMFREVTMDGALKYGYKPGLHKLGFRTGTGRFHWNMETEDTPSIHAALAELDTPFMVTASYDSNGFRRVDPELATGCAVHALFLGDSFTDGLWVSDADTFVSAYGRIVRERSGASLCPVNAGVNGYGSAEEAYVFENGFESAGRPLVVFVMFFANDVDADYDSVVRGTLPDRGHRWDDSLRQLGRMKQFANAHGAVLVIAAIPTSDQVFSHVSQEYYQRVLREFSEQEGIRFVNLIDYFDADEARSFYWDWDPHFTPRGHRAVAEALYAETAGLYK